MFFNSGIHIYDIKIEGKYTDGNNSGKFGFKLRRNEDIKDFEKKKNDLLKIMNEMGLKMKENQRQNKKIL